MNGKTARVVPHAAEEEVSPGCIIERRFVLAGLGGMLVTALPGAQLVAASDDDAGVARSFEQFLATANPVARDLVADASIGGQDRYLRSVAALASGLQGVPLPGKWNFSAQGDAPESYAIGFIPGGDPFRVLQWRLEPGASCRPHAHTYGNVVTLGLEGVARIRNYEVVGAPDYGFGGTFQVRQTVQQLLGPGAVNLVSLHRNYIHEIVAGPDGARGLDITTPLLERPDHGTPYLSMGEAPTDDLARIFDASWAFDK